jgi:hypothetical protein
MRSFNVREMHIQEIKLVFNTKYTHAYRSQMRIL